MSEGAESFYTSTTPGNPTSPTGPPPPPPPKPHGHIASNDPSRTGTPLSYAQEQQRPAPQLPTQSALQQQQPQYTASPGLGSPPPPPLPPNPSSFSKPGDAPHPAHAPQQSASYASGLPQSQQIPPPHPSERWLPEQPPLATYSIPDLTDLLNQPPLLHALSQSHPSYESAIQPLNTLLAQNLALAKELSQLESQLRAERDKTAQLMLNHTSLQQQWRRKQSEMDNALSPWQPRAMYQRLVASTGEQEALLRAIHESFLEGHGDGSATSVDGKASDREVAEWIRRIKEGTTTLERRRELKNRWDEGRVGGFR
ncbi:uncharacterized protein AB675_6350 [Cyphellophora attinorum]|uniref:VPS37 C-terminal domain-containing protein n=1 Tax=Cyphellophora attinorum TaxID=1664694 RepID=A0A0N1HEB7_9EURO|nr:uncharacterized protein AB675_6350 [Phialophora attinorum]KPI43720.1 hypothetical protein AB675_6350 [Phialophora attinorum]